MRLAGENSSKAYCSIGALPQGAFLTLSQHAGCPEQTKTWELRYEAQLPDRQMACGEEMAFLRCMDATPYCMDPTGVGAPKLLLTGDPIGWAALVLSFTTCKKWLRHAKYGSDCPKDGQAYHSRQMP